MNRRAFFSKKESSAIQQRLNILKSYYLAMAFELNEKPAIIGRSLSDIEKYGESGTVYIGKVVMSSGERPVLGRKIRMDVAKPHLILICGKRGGGKSYDMAVLIEEMARLPMQVRNRIAVIVIDTVGIFWSLKKADEKNAEELSQWDLKAQPTDIKVLVPKGKLDFYIEKEIPVDGAFSIKASELEANEWMALFKLTCRDPVGVLLTKVIESVREKLGTYFGIDEIIAAARSDDESESNTRQALVNRLRVAKTWGLIEKQAPKITDLAQAGAITIIDVSAYRQTIGAEGTKDIIVALVGKKLFEERMLFRKEEEIRLMKGKKRESGMPIVWMFIDEAHMFMPKDEENIALRVLLEWVRVGRQPGLSLVLATQRPDKLHPDTISQCDLFISHRMTSRPDIDAVSALRPSYLHKDFDKYYEEMPRSRGFAIILDDNSEKIWMTKIRPRYSWDAGVTASAFTD